MLFVTGDSGVDCDTPPNSTSQPIDLTISKPSHTVTLLEAVEGAEFLEPVNKKLFIDTVPYYHKVGFTLQV